MSAQIKILVDEQEDRYRLRMKESMTGHGLQDWVFEVPHLVQDCFDSFMATIMGLQDMYNVISQAAREFSDKGWNQLIAAPFHRIHLQDAEVHGAVFNRTEMTWKSFLSKGKGGKYTFLHIGNEPPTGELQEMLCIIGWLGVAVGPKPPESGFENSVRFVEIDPAKDEQAIEALMAPSGGKVPKPVHFPLVFVNVSFSLFSAFEKVADEAEDAPEEVAKDEAGAADAAGAEGAADAAGAAWDGITRFPPKPPRTYSGYGAIGQTVRPQVRQRLRVFRNCLAVGINRLAAQGNIVILWPGLPVHPVLIWLTATLRPLFQRVHVVTGEGSMTFEVYILAIGFKRDKAEDVTPGEGGIELKSFLQSSLRKDTLDDVLLWTLPPGLEQEEVNNSRRGGQARGHADLWEKYTQKLSELATEMAEERADPSGKKFGQNNKTGQIISESPGDSPKRTKAKAKAAAKQRDLPEVMATSPIRVEPELQAEKAPKPTPKKVKPLPEVPKADIAKTEERDEKEEKAKQKKEVDKEAARIKMLERKLRERNLPSLASTLGAAPGRKANGFPDREAFGATFPLIGVGLDASQVGSMRLWHRRRQGLEVSLEGDEILSISQSLAPTRSASSWRSPERRKEGGAESFSQTSRSPVRQRPRRFHADTGIPSLTT